MKANKYLYSSIFFILLSFFCSAFNPLMGNLFGSITSIILFTGIVNSVLLIMSIILSDMALKRRADLSAGAFKIAKWMPLIIFIVIMFHLFVTLKMFGIIF